VRGRCMLCRMRVQRQARTDVRAGAGVRGQWQGERARRAGRRALSRLVCARMSRSTDRHASVPLLTKRTISTLGTRSMTILASTFSSAHGAPNEVPCARRGTLSRGEAGSHAAPAGRRGRGRGGHALDGLPNSRPCSAAVVASDNGPFQPAARRRTG